METLQPKLRFSEFDGNWESKIFKKTCVINPSNKKLPQKFIYIDLESVNNGLLHKENEILLDEAPSRAQRLLNKKDVLFQMVRPYQKNNFYFDKEGDYVASTGYAQLRANDNSKFLFQYIHNQSFVDRVIEKCTGSNYPAINSTDLSNIFVVFPENNEQTKIANFLSVVDEKINLLKEKKVLLEDYKKGIMQKIFNQDSSDSEQAKQIRFKDDNGNDFGDWEVKTLDEISNIYQPKTISQTDLKLNGFDVYGANGIIGKYDKFNHELEQIAITCRGNTCGTVNYTKPKSWITGNAMVINTDDYKYIYKKYLFFLLYYTNFTYLITGSGQPQITGNIKYHKVQIPCIKEQTKIANFLSAIDGKIELVSNQIQDTQEYKKGLLQQMFV